MIGWLRRVTGIQKIGHAGTLDPLASGVLPICIGKAVRLSEYLLSADKAYQAEITFGMRTSTDDGEGEVIARQPAQFSREQLEQTLTEFVGEQAQTPPQYAAIKVAGQPLYKLARKGKAIKVTPRRIVIARLTLLELRLEGDCARAQLEIACGKGTYIRALARDLGERMGCGAYLSALTRTQCGAFKLSDAVTPTQLESAADWRAYLLPMDAGLLHWPQAQLSQSDAQRIRNGLAVATAMADAAQLVRAYDHTGQFFALLKCDSVQQVLRPVKVFLGD
jgi:tRNA pseudouridine55 synthase